MLVLVYFLILLELYHRNVFMVQVALISILDYYNPHGQLLDQVKIKMVNFIPGLLRICKED